MAAHTKLSVSHELGRARRVDGKQKLLVSVLEFSEDRIAIARAFVAKMVYDMATTRILLDRLETDPTTESFSNMSNVSIYLTVA